ncbi:hypothetical protein ACFLVB_04260 [Chloroflexota bacterium]
MHKRLDIIGGIGGCIGGAGLASIGYASGQTGTLEIGMAILVASAVYLLFRKRIAGSSNPSLPGNKSLTLIIHIAFFATFAVSIYLMHSSLFRPPIYFFLTSICVAVVAVGVLSSSSKGQTWLLLFEILLIAFSLRFGLLYELPGFYGVDPWVHSLIVEDWLDVGHFSAQTDLRITKYAELPVMHLNIMATRIITLLDPKNSYYFSIGLFYITSILFVFLLGQSVVNTKTGLLAALFLSIDIFHIRFAAVLIPTSLGVVIFVAVVWLIFKGTSNLSHTLILIVMSVVLVFTHPITALVTAIALSLFLIADIMYKKLFKTGVDKMRIGVNFVIFFWVLAVTTWVYSSYSPLESMLPGIINTLSTEVELVGAAFEASETSLGPLNRVGFLMLIGFIVIGSLSWLWQKSINNKRVAIIVSVFGLTIIMFFLPFVNVENLLTGRWLHYISILGVVAAAEGSMALFRLLSGTIMKSLAVMLILFIFSMFVINSVSVNTLTPFYGRDYMQDPNRDSLFESELIAVETIAEIYDGQITTDGPYIEFLFNPRVGLDRVKRLDIEGKNEDLIVIRNYLYTHPTIDRYNKEKYNHLLADFDGLRYNTVYYNGEVKGYLER